MVVERENESQDQPDESEGSCEKRWKHSHGCVAEKQDCYEADDSSKRDFREWHYTVVVPRCQ